MKFSEGGHHTRWTPEAELRTSSAGGRGPFLLSLCNRASAVSVHTHAGVQRAPSGTLTLTLTLTSLLSAVAPTSAPRRVRRVSSGCSRDARGRRRRVPPQPQPQPCRPPVPAAVASSLPGSPEPSPAEAARPGLRTGRLAAGVPASRAEPEGWSLRPWTQPPFTTSPLYKDWLIPIFSPVAFAMKNSTRSLIKFYACPTPTPKMPAKKKREGRLKPGTHLAKGTLVNKKVTHHELQVTPSVILNPLPGDLARAEFDFMNCELAMLKVCKLDINWTQKTWGAE